MDDNLKENIVHFISCPDVIKKCIKYYIRKKPPKYTTFCKLLDEFKQHAIECHLINGNENTRELYDSFIIIFESKLNSA